MPSTNRGAFVKVARLDEKNNVKQQACYTVRGKTIPEQTTGTEQACHVRRDVYFASSDSLLIKARLLYLPFRGLSVQVSFEHAVLKC